MAWLNPQHIIIVGVAISAIGAFLNSKQDDKFKDKVIYLQTEVIVKTDENSNIQRELKEKANVQAEAQLQLRKKSDEIAMLNHEIALSQTELRKKSDEVADLNRKIVATVTGGDSYGSVLPLSILDKDEEVYNLYFENNGAFPLYDVSIRMWNPDDFKNHRPDGRATIEHNKYYSNYDLGNIPVHGGKGFWHPFKLNDGEKLKLNFSISAKNGSFSQLLRIVKVGESILFAQKVNKISQEKGVAPKILLNKASDKFPHNRNGEIEWE